MNPRVWFIKSDRMSELKKKIETSSLTRVPDPEIKWYWMA